MAEKLTYEELERRVQELEKIESKYKSSKEALQKSENLFKLLYEKAPLGYQSLDENGNFIVVNKTWLDVLGYSKEEVIGKSFADFLHPEWRDHFKENFSWFKSVGEILGVEFEMVKKNGDFILVSFTGRISRDEKRNFQQTHCIFHDITERKKHEKLLEIYKNIVSSTTDAIAYLDENYRYIIVNNAYEDFSATQRDNFIGMTVAEYMGKDIFEEKIKSNLDRCLNGEVVNYQEWFEYPIKGKRFVDLTYVPYRDGENHISGVIANTKDITEKKQVEDTLTRERRMMARTESVAHVGSWEWEAEGDKVTWSKQMFRIFGLESMEQAPSFTEHQAFYVPEDRIRLVEAVEECLQNSVPFDLEVSFTRTDGQLRHCVVRGFPEYGDNGVVNRLYGSLHDITERKCMEKALRESENQISSIFRGAPVGIGSVVNGVLSKVNDHLCEMIGYDQSELIGQSARILYPGDKDFEFVGREQYAQITDHGTGTVETRWQKKDGTIMDVLLSSTPVNLKDKSKGVTFTALDITERKRVEMALKESEERFRTLMENIDAVAVQGYGPDGTTQYWNKASERLYGYSQQEAIGRNFIDLIIPSEMKGAVVEEVRKMAESGQPIPSGELLLRHKDGSKVPVISHHAIVKVPGREQELFCLDVDMTERKRVEKERENLRKQLNQAQKMESVGRLAGGRMILTTCLALSSGMQTWPWRIWIPPNQFMKPWRKSGEPVNVQQT